jgi:5-methylcytosine-specific restriction endonuclease McrA
MSINLSESGAMLEPSAAVNQVCLGDSTVNDYTSDIPQNKACNKCGQSKPATTEFFARDKSKKDGLRSNCKACQRKWREENPEYQRKYHEENPEYDRRYREENHEAISERKRKWREENPEYARRYRKENAEKRREYDRGFREENPEYARKWREENPEYDRRYHEENREAISERHRQWREANPEYARKWREANPEKVRERNRKYREENRQRYIEHARAWREANPEKVRAAKVRRRARKRNATGSFTAEDIKAIYKSQEGRCWWCQCEVGDTYHIDHIIPLARGGSNAANNLVIACPTCNLQKGAKMPHEFKGRLF